MSSKTSDMTSKTSDMTSVRPKIRSKHSEKLSGEPLERRTIRFEDKDGIERYYPALHIKFSHTMVFVKYIPPPMNTMADLHLNGHDLTSNVHIQRWMSVVNSFQEMIKALLRLQHNQFWSTLVHERSLQISLESYLRYAPRSHHLYNSLISNDMKTCLKRVHNLVFKLYLRMCSFTESKKHYISENTFGSLVYDNYLIDFPKIIDLSVLYADTNYHQLLTRMLENVVKCQPKYTDDLLKGSNHFNELFHSLSQRLGTDENQIETNDRIKFIQWSELQSIIANITELSVCMRSLTLSVPQIANHYRNVSIGKTIVEFYNRVFPLLQNELITRFESLNGNELIGEQIEKQLLIARSNLMFTFREIIKICFIDQLMDPKTKKQLKVDLMDQFIETLTSASFEKNFINDYCPQYAVEKDLEELSKNSELTQFESLDKTRIDYLKSLIQSSISTEGKSCDISNEGKDLCQIGGQVNGVESSDEVNEVDVKLESQIQYIREIIPELGAGFVHKCLEFYNLDNEKVLNAILEDNLPPPLSSLDRSLQKVSTKKTNEKKVKTNEKTRNSDNNDLPQTIPQTIPQVIDERKNIYNNDEFDIFRNKNIDLNRIHLGKKEKTVPKMDVKTREKIMSLHYMALEEEENEAMRYYDDEYDDTYEDDTKIDLICDKLMDELDTNENDNQTNANTGREMTNKNNYTRRPRNYR